MITMNDVMKGHDNTKMIMLDGTQDELTLQAVIRMGIDIRSYLIQKSQGVEVEKIEIFLDRVSSNIDHIIKSHDEELVHDMFNRIEDDMRENGNQNRWANRLTKDIRPKII